MLHPRIVLTAILALVAGAPLLAQPPDPPLRAPRPDDDRIEVSLFVGEVLNNFSSTSRLDYVDPDAGEDAPEIERVAGLTFRYALFRHLELYGEAVHSARTVEVPCAGSGAADCIGQPADFFRIVHAANTLEWFGGFRLRRALDRGGAAPDTVVYLKGQAGFIRAEQADDDLIDNHFYGVGVEHVSGPFRDSFIEIGGGRTDFFAPDRRSGRWKLGSMLSYTPALAKRASAAASPAGPDPIVSLFAQGWLDTDLGPGSDDIQIYFGLAFDVGALVEAVRAARQGG